MTEAEIFDTLQEIAESLRTTADGLRKWDAERRRETTGERRFSPEAVHPFHAAKRLDNIATRISAKREGATS